MRRTEMISYKLMITAKLPDGRKKFSVEFYDSFKDAETDMKILKLTQPNILDIHIEEVNKKP